MQNNMVKNLAEELEVDINKGISSKEVALRTSKYGKNKIEGKKKKSLFFKVLEQFTDILILILLTAAIISVLIDPSEWIESMIIMIVILLNTVLGIVQESKAEKSLEALMSLSSPKCKVFRDGEMKLIDSVEVVVGDILLLSSGDYISADGVVVESAGLTVDESTLTGESIPVVKNENSHNEADRKIYSSTFVTKGHAKCLVDKVGINTEIGKIAELIKKGGTSLTPLQNKLTVVGKVIGILAILICVVVFILEMATGMEVLEAFKTSVALAVAAIPEGLASVVTIVLALGVERMARNKAIVKKLPAVETLGSCNVICTDKTGTLTENKMTIKELYTRIGEADLNNMSHTEKEIIHYFSLCCDAEIDDGKRLGDATELAIIECKMKYAADFVDYERIEELPFDSNRKLMSVLCKKNNQYLQITKGAPDVLMQKCKSSFLLEQAKKVQEKMSQKALRVLAIGIKEYQQKPKFTEAAESELQFLGLIGMLDPAKEGVKEAIAAAKNAGIRTVMITGDHKNTALSIATELGIFTEGSKVITSAELKNLTDEELEACIGEYSVFARAVPHDKVRIVEAWQRNHMVVAMTGDGVNDAPALKMADIGCAMGITGTDVAKEASDMILVDDDFSTIVTAVKEGRGIYDNIRKCIQYLLSSNIGEVLTIFVASILAVLDFIHVGVPLKPIHLLWINLITDALPAFGLGMERPSDEVMRQKPKGKKEGFFTHKLGLKIVIEGVLIGFLTLTAYLIGFASGERTGQTMAFLTLSTCQLFHAYNVKGSHSFFSKKTFSNRFLNFAFIVGFSLQIAVLYVPYLGNMFQLEALKFTHFAISMALAMGVVFFMEIGKMNRKKR